MNTFCADSSVAERPAVQPGDGGSIPTSALHFEIATREQVKSFIEKHHYSHSIRGVGCRAAFTAHMGGELVGAALFAQTSTQAWVKFSTHSKQVLELRRFVLLDKAPKNSESRFLGWTLRWLKRNMPDIAVVVAYSDPMFGHVGTIYQAANFDRLPAGTPNPVFRDAVTGLVYHRRSLTKKIGGKLAPSAQTLVSRWRSGGLVKVPAPAKRGFYYTLKTDVLPRKQEYHMQIYSKECKK